MSLPPVEIPLGAMRFNSDSQKLEYWNGSAWFQIHTFSPNLDGGVRGCFGGGFPSSVDTIEYITISTQGNAIDFGNLTSSKGSFDAAGSRTRGFWFGGESPNKDEIDFITFSSTGNATDFGNLTVARFGPAAGSNSTRAVVAGGNNPPTDVIDYITMSSAGNAQDFGDLKTGFRRGNAGNSPTRVIFYGGANATSVIQFLTTATTGNTEDFGETFTGGYSRAKGAVCSSTRALFAGNASPQTNNIEYITMSSGGNGMKFGELPVSGSACAGRLGCSSVTRGVTAGGGGSPAKDNSINYVNIATFGDAVDFGDLTTTSTQYGAGCSNGHGGLG